MKELLNVCGYNDSPIYIDDNTECDSCDWMEQRMENLEICCESTKASIQKLQEEIDNKQTSDKHYTYVQPTPSAQWYVTHGLEKYPSVTVVDSAGTEVIGDVDYIDKNNVLITFYGAFSGRAYFN